MSKQFLIVAIFIGTVVEIHCATILSHQGGQWLTTKRTNIGQHGKTFHTESSDLLWHSKHGLQQREFRDETRGSRQKMPMGETSESFADINNWAHQKLYGHQANEDFSEESQEKNRNGRMAENDNFDEIKDWAQRKLYTPGMNEISSQEFSDNQPEHGTAIGENNESFDFVNNWAHKLLYGHRADNEFRNSLD